MFKNMFVISKNEFTTKQALKRQTSHVSGLTISEVHKRMHRFGLNQFTTLEKSAILRSLFNDLKAPATLILLFAVGLCNLLHQNILAAIILSLVVLTFITKATALVRFNQQVVAAQAILAEDFLVIREGLGHRVNAARLVPGDIVFLSAGDDLPANMNLFDDSTLQLDTKTATFGAKVVAGEGFAIVMATGETIIAQPELQLTFVKKVYQVIQNIWMSIRTLSQAKSQTKVATVSSNVNATRVTSEIVTATDAQVQAVIAADLSEREPSQVTQISLKYEQPRS
ncbi:cation-transporting P-type ATPase [Agrilactobacillus yilanensis]|uniref:Cation-transporting P-type ATPase n=1 Tax=Agrilactobacillus yilanensis TaxID=2485997 RepID=A0ABW4J7I0_9LACO|nr:cation-transporting P-type ATPase [Agrilactobacillus yilanensis]